MKCKSCVEHAVVLLTVSVFMQKLVIECAKIASWNIFVSNNFAVNSFILWVE